MITIVIEGPPKGQAGVRYVDSLCPLARGSRTKIPPMYILSLWCFYCCFGHHLDPAGDFLTRRDELSGLSFSLFSELVDLHSF